MRNRRQIAIGWSDDHPISLCVKKKMTTQIAPHRGAIHIT